MSTFKIGTWNMQGLTGDGESKWKDVKNIIRAESLDYLCLQECGDLPSVRELFEVWAYRPKEIHVSHGVARKSIVYYEVRPVSDSHDFRSRNIGLYYMGWDGAGNRVNYGIIVAGEQFKKGRHDVLSLAEGAGFGRPALGIMTNNFHLYSMHGGSGNGNDVNGTLKTIASSQTTVTKTFVLGDFNIEYEDYMYIGWQSMDPGAYTHPKANPDRKIDYGFNNINLNEKQWLAKVLDVAVSDHYPVVYEVSNF